MSGRTITPQGHHCHPGMKVVERTETTDPTDVIPLPPGRYLVDEGAPNGSTWICDDCGTGWVRDVDGSWWDRRTGRGVFCAIFNWRRETRRERRRRVKAEASRTERERSDG